MLRPFGFMKAAAAGGGITDPNDVGAVVWLDMTDFTYQKQNADGTGDVTATGQDVRYLVDRATGQTNDFETKDGSAAGVSASGSLSWNSANFIPDASLTGFTSNMEVYILLSTSDTSFLLLGKNNDGDYYAGLAVDGGSGNIENGTTGTITYSTNGVDETSPTRDSLHAAWSTGSNVIAGLRGIDLSSGVLTSLMPLAYQTSFAWLTGSVLHFVVVPGPMSSGDRSDLIDWLKSEGGIA